MQYFPASPLSPDIIQRDILQKYRISFTHIPQLEIFDPEKSQEFGNYILGFWSGVSIPWNKNGHQLDTPLGARSIPPC